MGMGSPPPLSAASLSVGGFMFKGLGVTDAQNSLIVAQERETAVEARLAAVQDFWSNIAARIQALPDSDRKTLLLQRLEQRRAKLTEILTRLLSVKQTIVAKMQTSQVAGLRGLGDEAADIAALQAEVDQQNMLIIQLQTELAMLEGGQDTTTIITQPVTGGTTVTLVGLALLALVLGYAFKKK